MSVQPKKRSMVMRKQLIAAGIATAVGVTGLVGVNVVNAATDTSSSTNPMSSLVDAIASKFSLNKDDVQAVFDEQRDKMEAEREAEAKQEVAQLVTDGKLTQEQADKINAKRAELKAEREAAKDSNDDKTREEMKDAMKSRRDELKQWASDNDIDEQYLRYVMGGGHGHGPGGPGMRPESSDDSSS